MTFVVTFAMLAGLLYLGRGVLRYVGRTSEKDRAMQTAIQDLAVRLQDPCCPAFAEHGAQASVITALRHRWTEVHSPDCPSAQQVVITRHVP
jgi:hypothetical protein